jgi:DNA-binding NtrC family response regulator
LKILVVEFEEGLRNLIVTSLREKGHDVLIARTAKDGLRLYRRSEPMGFVATGLFLDGKTTGAQFIQRLLAIKPDQAYGIITGERVLAKPFSKDRICRFVESLGFIAP